MIDPNHPHKIIGDAIVKHVNSGAHDDAPIWDAHFHPDWESIEATGEPGPDGREMSFKGRAAVEAKCKAWMEQTKMHSCVADGPYVGKDGFAIRYTIDCESTDGTWPRMTMSEVGMYTVEDGKVVREVFMYQPMEGCE